MIEHLNKQLLIVSIINFILTAVICVLVILIKLEII